MGFLKKLEQMDAVVNRFYARYKVWIWSIISLPVIYFIGWAVWVMVWAPPMGGVALIIHSEIDRPIRGFSVNGMSGANAAAHNPNNPYAIGGAGTVCCGSVSGKTAEVIWTVDYTRAQYNAGVRTEVHKVTLPLPERKRGEDDLHVHFLPDNKVMLGWSDNAWSPFDPRNPKNQGPESNSEE